MDWHVGLALTSLAFQIASAIPYYWDTFFGSTRPSFVSMFLWTLLGVLEVAAQWSAGASWTIVLVGIVTLNTGMFSLLALVGYGYKKFYTTDAACLVLGPLAAIAWYLTGDPVIALWLALAANFIATIPTVRKSYVDPASEQWLAWFLLFVASAFSIAATTLWTPANLIIPGFILLESALISGLSFFGQRLKRAST